MEPRRRLSSRPLAAIVALGGVVLGYGLADAAAPKNGRRGPSRGAKAMTGAGWVKGVKFTVYGSGDGGACSMGVLPRSDLPFAGYVAAGGDLWDGGKGCGRFLEIRGGSGPTCTAPIDGSTRTVMIVDHCPECDEQHLDLTLDVWGQLTESSGCIIAGAAYREVPGLWTDNVRVTFDASSHAHWARLRVGHHNRPIESVALRGAGSTTWHTLSAASGQGVFSGPLGSGLALPISVRVQSDRGETLVAPGAVSTLPGEHDLGWQFAPSFGMTLVRGRSSSAKRYVAKVHGAAATIESIQLRGAGNAKWGPAIAVPDGRTLQFQPSRTLGLPISLKLNSSVGQSVVAVDAITKLVGAGTDPIKAQFTCTQKVESTCNDGVDNDCDGKVDADDPNC